MLLLKNKPVLGLASAVMALTLGGCGGSSSDNDSGISALSIAGTLALSSTFNMNATEKGLRLADNDFYPAALSDMKVVCSTIVAGAISSGTGTVNSSGEYNLSLNTEGGDIGCIIFENSDILALVKFYDSSDAATDMSGNTKQMSTIGLTGTVTGLNITVDVANGTAAADVKDVAVKTVDASTAFDPTGSWTIAKHTLTAAEKALGYSEISSTEGEGPAVGEAIYIRRLNGKAFTPDATCKAAVQTSKQDGTAVAACNGTTGGDAYGLQIWASKQAFESCGSKLGFSHVEAKAFGGIDFTGDTTVGEGAFTWSAGYTDGWKKTTATASHDEMDCTSATYGGIPAWKCNGTWDDGLGGGTVGAYQINLNRDTDGCFINGTSTRVFPRDEDWQEIWGTQDNPVMNTCTDTNETIGGLVFHHHDCVTANTITRFGSKLKCVNTGGMFLTTDDSAITGMGTWANTNLASQGDLCSSMANGTDAEKLAQLRCYAEASYGSDEHDDTKCLREVRTNWDATTPADFVRDHGDGPAKARLEHVFELLHYSSANSASLTQTNHDIRNFSTPDGQGSVNCEIEETMTFVLTKVSDSKLTATMEQSSVNMSSDKPSCQAAVSKEQGKFIFDITK